MTLSQFIRGAAEAHTGTPWSWAARERVIRYLGDLGFNLYVYAPQGDPLVRERWWEPYLRDEVDAFVDMAQLGARRGVRFCYGLWPEEPDTARVLAKLKPLYDGGIRFFALLGADGALCRAILAELPGTTLLSDSGSEAPPEVEVLVATGGKPPAVADVLEAGRLCRRPPVLWEPYPGSEQFLHLRPAPGWAPGVLEEAAGVLVDVGPNPEAARVPLHTWAAFLRNPGTYDAERAWVQALAHVAGEAAPALRLLGELTQPGVQLQPGAADPRIRLEAWARAADVLKNIPDKPLREDLRPWVAKLALSADAGLKALAAVAAPPGQAERLRGLALSALWRLRESGVWVAGDQMERYIRDCLRSL